ncbi:MAG TPA: alpha-amylase family glycosyl hydrolase [Bryobacteraceae bacterium]|nr:alpha-amylase family glycosyl hydrolase [Bryobacteraceae bacterium]
MSSTAKGLTSAGKHPDIAPVSSGPLPPQPRAARPYPALYQINTRVLLSSLSRELGRKATLNDLPDSLLDRLAQDGFDWVWFLGVWQTGDAGRQVSLANPEWQREFRELLPDFSDRDVCGSCFAIRSYTVHSDLGGNAALENLRGRIHSHGMRLLLDFVPNHMAPDHAWAQQHPEYFIQGTDNDIAREPQNYTRIDTPNGRIVMAYGRDPYFPGWPDTLQLNYANRDLQEAMTAELGRIAELCEGVRCDMAMLILPDVFERTWGKRPEPFWPEAIARTRARQPGFLFMAEAYWDLEWQLQQQGFDYTYDKRLYDRLREGHARPVRDHFRADMDYQRKSVRFLENHDEPRAAAVFSPETHQAAAILTFLCPGLRFVHQGQRQGLSSRIPVHLSRGPAETSNPELDAFYDRLLGCLRNPSAHGEWRLLECLEAWDGNGTWDCYIGFAWRAPDQPSLIVVVNYAAHQSQCYMRIPDDLLSEGTLRLSDLMSDAVYDREGDDLRKRGLYLDLPPWGYHVFEMTT